ncbi:MAG: carboxypeptidase, partial [Elusimicrobia bacterium]|nr:carboxypeptidase [Elusimicrobiota bacterium]
DRPISFRLPGGRHWRPRNYGNRYYGKVTLETALRKSLNSVAVRLLQGVGVSGVIDLMSRAAGLPAEGFPRNLSLALGTVDASVIDLARGYSIFVNGGRPVVPYWLLFIEARDGSLLRDERSRPAPAAPILKLETCRTMLELMSGVLKPGGTAGTAAARSGFNIPAAGKSGTTNDYRDAWFTGMTPDVSASVWIGHDDMRLPLLHGEAGGAVAAPAWMSFMKAAYRDRPTRKLDALLPDKL